MENWHSSFRHKHVEENTIRHKWLYNKAYTERGKKKEQENSNATLQAREPISVIFILYEMIVCLRDSMTFELDLLREECHTITQYTT